MKFETLCSLEKLGSGGCGIHPRKNENYSVFLINKENICYEDEVTNNVINYQGEGKTGDQTFTRKNKSIQDYVQKYQNDKSKVRIVEIYKKFEQDFSQCVAFTKKGSKCNIRVNEEGGCCGIHGGPGLTKMNTLWQCIGTFILVNSYMDKFSDRNICIFTLLKVNNIPRIVSDVTSDDDGDE